LSGARLVGAVLAQISQESYEIYPSPLGNHRQSRNETRIQMSQKQLEKLAQKLFAETDLRESFIAALTSPAPMAQALIWRRPRPAELPFLTLSPQPWQASFVDRVSTSSGAGKHELHEQGAYYCLDFASTVAASIVAQLEIQVSRVLDLCSSPGGKAVFLATMFEPEVLYCNEVVGKRLGSLISNLKRCAVKQAIVTQADSSVWAKDAAEYFDLVFVDAPCSGQSLIVKGKTADGCFHPVTIKGNAMRQRRILANAATCVSPGGYLAYTTCTFSPEENEEVGTWFLKRFAEFQAVEAPQLNPFSLKRATWPCYQIYPHHDAGAGGFAALFRRLPRAETREKLASQLPKTIWQYGRATTAEGSSSGD
jgi:16S rRNA C967 or C1407 C5-methylase (RsmB/RsmF family)